MNYLAKFASVAILGLASAGFAGAAQWDKKTTITIDEPLQLPKTMLQPGTYVIRLADSGSNRHIVQIFDKDEKNIVNTILAIPNERLKPTGKSVFAFWEVPAGQPKALRAWFYPGDNFGQEFAYPKTEAVAIAANNNGARVPESDDNVELSSRSTTTASETVATSAPPAPVEAAPAPQPEPVQVAADAQQNRPEPPPVAARDDSATQTPAATGRESDAQRRANEAPAGTPAPEELPKTASNLPLFAFLGVIAIVSALMLNMRYRRG